MSETVGGLDDFIPRPTANKTKRHMIAVTEEDFHNIVRLSDEYGTTRGKIVTALIEFYEAEDE